jgi:methylase of polypeptide subunit release factors
MKNQIEILEKIIEMIKNLDKESIYLLFQNLTEQNQYVTEWFNEHGSLTFMCNDH